MKNLVRDSGFPGMRVLQFAFDAHGDSDYLPHCCDYMSVCYIGTHDNDTVNGWLKTTGKDENFIARVDPRTTSRGGDKIKVGFDVNRLHFFDVETEKTILSRD